MKSSAKASGNSLAHVAFAAAGLSVLGMALALHHWMQLTVGSAREAGEIEEILRTTHQVNEQLSRAEAALRAYLLAGEAAKLEPQRVALGQLEASSSRLGELVAGDPAQAGRVERLYPLVAGRIEVMDETLRRYRQGGIEAARRYADAGAAAAASSAIYDLIDEIRQHELERRDATHLRHQQQYVELVTILIAAVLASLLLLAAGYAVLLRQRRARDEAEGTLRDMTERVPGALFRYRQVRGGHSYYEFVSRDVATLLGTDRETAMRNSAALLSHVVDEDRPALAEAIRQAGRTLGQFQHEFRVRLGSGDMRWLRCTAALRGEADGSVLWNGYWSDITEQKVAETERDRFFTMSLDMLCICGADGYFKRLNPAWTDALGWSIEEMQSRPFMEFVHPDDLPATLREFERQVAAGEPVLQFENRYQHKDGSWRVLSWRSVPQSDGLLYATARDVTDPARIRSELIRAKEQADAASRAKSTFLATMSHEIRTPLNGVLGMIELLGMTQLDAEQRATVEVVRRSGESLRRIIDDILEFSKIEAGRLDIRPEPASIASIVAAVRDIYAGVASGKGLLLEHSVDPRISPALVVDALRLQQILNNFVSNALKFTAAGRVRITVQLIERSDHVERVRLSVADTGIGIPPELQQRLFQPFTQAESDTTRRFGGTGLGLTISRSLAGLMGGSIEMESTPGQGTVISVVLPMPIADPRDLPAAPADVDPAGAFAPGRWRPAPGIEEARAEGTLILLVDDHQTNRALLLRQLNTLGYAAETAEDGAQALAMWRKARYGLIVADCNMPVMDGYELARRIRASEQQQGLPRTPIVACTANALRGEAEACLAAGMDGYLSKPVQLAQLEARIGAWLPLAGPTGLAFAPTLAASAAEPELPVDRTVLAMVSGSQPGMERDILREFQRINDRDAAAVVQAAGRTDLDGLTRTCHRIKGASRTVGAVDLARACDTLERAARAGDWPAVETGVVAFRIEMQRLNAYIARL